jgi:hypothetical protein
MIIVLEVLENKSSPEPLNAKTKGDRVGAKCQDQSVSCPCLINFPESQDRRCCINRAVHSAATCKQPKSDP